MRLRARAALALAAWLGAPGALAVELDSGDWKLDLGGTLSQHWESQVDGQVGVTGVTGTVTFTGVTHNATLSPGASTRFGFCVMR